jgi:hypothetical protein
MSTLAQLLGTSKPVKELTKQETLDRLLAVWEANPRLRLGQLWQHATRGVAISYLFDDELVKLLELNLPKPEEKRAKRKVTRHRV